MINRLLDPKDNPFDDPSDVVQDAILWYQDRGFPPETHRVSKRKWSAEKHDR